MTYLEEGIELANLVSDFMRDKKWHAGEVISYFGSSLAGVLVLNKASEEQVDKIFKEMTKNIREAQINPGNLDE